MNTLYSASEKWNGSIEKDKQKETRDEARTDARNKIDNNTHNECGRFLHLCFLDSFAYRNSVFSLEKIESFQSNNRLLNRSACKSTCAMCGTFNQRHLHADIHTLYFIVRSKRVKSVLADYYFVNKRI